MDTVIQSHPDIFKDENWFPFGGDENMFGVVRGQQSNPIAAIVEKVTNSIDAILVKNAAKLVSTQNRQKLLNQWRNQ